MTGIADSLLRTKFSEDQPERRSDVSKQSRLGNALALHGRFNSGTVVTSLQEAPVG